MKQSMNMLPKSLPEGKTDSRTEESVSTPGKPLDELSLNKGRKSEKHAPKARKVPVGLKMVWGVTFLTVATFSAAVGAILAMVGPLPSLPMFSVKEEAATAGTTSIEEAKTKAIPPLFQYKVERPVNILVMGIDRVLDAPEGSDEAFSGNTDTMLLLRFDPTDSSLRLLSIPRDTQVIIPRVGQGKINAANVYGGPQLAMQVVSRTLNDVPIDRYVRVTNDAFQELVDLVGGVEVYVPQPMSYVDRTQNLKIDLKPGWQRLNGDEAEQFARFRMDEYGDIGRVQRQQVLLKALRERLEHPTVLPRLPKAVQLMLQYVDTNLSLEEILALVNFGMSLDRDNIRMVLLPGRFSEVSEFEGISYWIMSRQGRDRVVAEYFDQMGTSGVPRERDPKRVRIAIQNASNDSELPRKAVEYLNQQGFHNIYYSNRDFARPLRTTEIIVQQGDRNAAQALQTALGFGRVEANSTGDLGSEITIRVGADWYDLLGQSKDETES